MRLLFAATLLLIYAVFCPSFAESGTAPATNNPAFTPAWQTFKLGAGGFVTDILIYPDGTEIATTDTYGFYLWNGTIWNQLFTAATIPERDLSPALGDCAGSGCIAGYGIAACAYPTASGPTLVGSTSILYAIWNAKIYKSTNKGMNWTNTGQAITGANGNDGTQKLNKPYVWCDPASSGQIAVVSVPGAAPLLTTNGGTTWSTIAGINPPTGSNGSLIVSDPVSSVVGVATQTVYISSYGTGVYRSTTGAGGTFNLTSGTPTSHSAMWVDKFSQLWLLTGQSAAASLRKFTSGSWSASTISANGAASAIALDPNSTSATANHLDVLRASGHIQDSANNGASFTGYNFTTTAGASDIPWLGATQQGQIPRRSDLYLNTGKAMYDMSSNLLLSGGIGVWKAPAPVTPTSNFMSQSSGIEQLVVNRVISPPGSSPLVAVWDRGFFLQKNPDIYPSSHYTTSVAISGGWDLTWAAQTPSFLTGNNNSNIGMGEFSAYSNDGGNTWTAWPSFPNGTKQIGGMVAAATTTDWIAVPGQAQKLYCTTNAAVSWNEVSLPLSPAQNWLNNYSLTRHVLTADKVNIGTYYAYIANAGLFSTSTGCSGKWSRIFGAIDRNRSFEGFNSKLEAVPLKAGHLFFTNGWQSGSKHPFDQLFYRSINGGVIWSSVINLKEVRAFGFGAPKPGGGGYPAIVINGWVSGAYGIWVSTDNASTWNRIGTYPNNDVDLVTDVSGDNNVYGRYYVCFRGSGCAYYDTQDACPWVNFSKNNPNASLTGTVTLEAQRSGLGPVSGVQFQVDGMNIGLPQTGSGPYSVSWGTDSVAAGQHTLSVVTTGNGCNDTGSTFSIPITTY
jgi:hypothetical protein